MRICSFIHEKRISTRISITSAAAAAAVVAVAVVTAAAVADLVADEEEEKAAPSSRLETLLTTPEVSKCGYLIESKRPLFLTSHIW